MIFILKTVVPIRIQRDNRAGSDPSLVIGLEPKDDKHYNKQGAFRGSLAADYHQAHTADCVQQWRINTGPPAARARRGMAEGRFCFGV